LHFDQNFTYAGLKEILLSFNFIPKWIMPGLDFIVGEFFDLPIKPSKDS